jgi:ABC-2 type transport system permease protein
MTHFTGTWTLTRVAIRRERLQLLIWIGGLSLFVGLLALAVSNVLETEEDIRDFTEFYVVNPAMRLFGLPTGVSEPGFVFLRGGWILFLLASLLSTFAVVRHTRQNEDTRRSELVRSSVVGRHATLASALIIAVTANVLLSALSALALIANGYPTAGSIMGGLAIGCCGVAFAGIAAVTSQLSGTGRGANGLAAMALGIAFLVTGSGNMLGTANEAEYTVTAAFPAWFSPVGWSQQMDPYHGNNWWVLVIPAVFFVAAALAAFRLESLRDLGRGMMPERRGPPTASPALLSPFGLVWRLQKGMLIGWAIGIGVFAVVLGSLAGEIERLMSDIEGISDLITRMGGTQTIADAYFSTMIGLIGSVVTIYALQVLLRMRSDEENGLAEPVLATAVSRNRWTLGFVANAAVGVALLLILGGLVMGVSAAISLEDGGQVGSLLSATAAQIPATFLIAGAVMAAFGLLPRRAAVVSWGIFALAIATGPIVGELLNLPGWVRDVSPFTHSPLAPAAEVTLVPIVVLTGIAMLLAAAGVATFRRRDLALQA